jgi:ABC-type dipeptide/oligopeptide/nickel transport system permease component
VLGGAPTTFVIVFGAIAIAYSLGVALGVLSALQRGRKADVAIAVTVLAANAVPTAVVAVALRSTHASTSLLWATLVVAAGLVAAPTRHQRSALTTTLSSDFVRAAVARGAGPFRTVVFHGLRNSLIPVVTLATLEPPMALGATFVVEHVFALRGLGAMTVEAVGARDTGFLMALSVLLAAVASLAVVVTDVAHALVDPRSRHKLARGRT